MLNSSEATWQAHTRTTHSKVCLTLLGRQATLEASKRIYCFVFHRDSQPYFTPETTTGQWIGYQIITTLGRGMAFQVVRVISELLPNREP